ncbi:putative vesicle coat complex COPI, beta [Chytridium lagenaria]|nr:putative vesicle coat complex COPI, beta [Chytridium lagenaria]
MEIETADVIRLVLQFCKENNLNRTFEILQEESNVHLNAVDSVDAFLSNVHAGKWDLKMIDLYEHIIIELMEMKEIGAARSLLRQTDTMLYLRDTNPDRYLRLEELLSKNYFDEKEFYQHGSKERRRAEIGSALASEVNVAPPSRLLSLIGQSLKYQQSQGLLPADFAYDLFRGAAITAKTEDDCPPSQCFRTIKFPRKAKAESAAFSPDGQNFVTGTLDGLIEVWNYFTGKHRLDLKYQQEENFMMMDTAILCLSFGRENDVLASGSQDGNIKIWRVSTGQCIRRFISAHSQGVTSVKFSKDNTQVLSGSFDFTLRLHGIKSGKMLKEFRGHISYVNDVQFSADGSRVYSASSDGTLKIWDSKSASCLSTITLHEGKAVTGGVESSTVSKILALPTSDNILVCNKSPFLYLLSPRGQVVRTYFAKASVKKGESLPDFITAAFSAKGEFVYGITNSNHLFCFSTENGSLTNSFEVYFRIHYQLIWARFLNLTSQDSLIIPFQNICAVMTESGVVALWKA